MISGSTTDQPQDQVCVDCGHIHAGEGLGHICIGCVCETRPAARVDADTPKQRSEKVEVDRATLYGIAWDLRTLADRIAQLADGHDV